VRITPSKVHYRLVRHLRDRKSVNGGQPVEMPIKGCQEQHKNTANDHASAQG
jgi:hypothetical protein